MGREHLEISELANGLAAPANGLAAPANCVDLGFRRGRVFRGTIGEVNAYSPVAEPGSRANPCNGITPAQYLEGLAASAVSPFLLQPNRHQTA
jgi:hypothetical protein